MKWRPEGGETRSSYKAGELRWGVRFASMFEHADDDRAVAMDIGRVHDVEEVDLADARPATGSGA